MTTLAIRRVDPAQSERRSRFGLELRAAADGVDSPGTLAGYAVVWNVLSDDIGGFRERVQPGCFSKSLKTTDVRALADHEQETCCVIGRLSAGTLRLSEDDIGLRFEIDLPDTTAGRDLAVSVSRRDVNSMSFGFITIVDQWDWSGATVIRDLIEAELVEISVVAWAAYPQTSVALRSLAKARETAAAPATTPPAETPPPAPPVEDSGLSLRAAALRLAELG